jgi:hypothetical protein
VANNFRQRKDAHVLADFGKCIVSSSHAAYATLAAGRLP